MLGWRGASKLAPRQPAQKWEGEPSVPGSFFDEPPGGLLVFKSRSPAKAGGARQRSLRGAKFLIFQKCFYLLK